MTSNRYTHTDGLGLLLNIGLIGVRVLRFLVGRGAHPYGKPAASRSVRGTRTPRASLTSSRAYPSALTVLIRGHYWDTPNVYSVLNSGQSRILGPLKGLNSVYRRCKLFILNISNPVTKGIYGDFTGGRGVFSTRVPLVFTEQNPVFNGCLFTVRRVPVERSRRF